MATASSSIKEEVVVVGVNEEVGIKVVVGRGNASWKGVAGWGCCWGCWSWGCWFWG